MLQSAQAGEENEKWDVIIFVILENIPKEYLSGILVILTQPLIQILFSFFSSLISVDSILLVTLNPETSGQRQTC